MKLTIKTLQQKVFKIDVEPTETVADLKNKITNEHGHPPELQKLIHSGKILVDTNTIETYNIKESDFIVLMVSKPKPAPTVAAKAPEPTPAPTPPAAAAPVIAAEPPTPAATPSDPQPAPVATGSERPFGETSSFLSGQELQKTIQNMMEMGFEREQIMRALRASYNNPDRAVEYLMSGIPEHLEGVANAAPAPAPAAAATPAAPRAPPANIPPQLQRLSQAAQAAAQPGGAAPAQPAATPAAQPAAAGTQNLFQLAQQQQQQHQHQGGGGGIPAAGGLPNAAALEGLRNDPQIGELRNLVMQNPALLQPMIQQIAQANPGLAEYLGQNPEALLQLLGTLGGEGGFDDGEGEGGVPPGAHVVHVTPEESAAIERLQALGFPREIALEAYLACDKNEEMAANYLFENGFDD